MNRPPLDTQMLRRAVADDPQLSFYSGIDVVESTGSTNADLLAKAADADADGRVLVAETQDRGRGRHDRVWVSPPRAQLAMSISVRPLGIAPESMGWLPLLTGVAVVDAVRATTGLDANLKWPNDVLVGGKKVAGILAEVGAGPQGPTVVIGIGLNVSLAEAELPVPHATSLALAGAPEVDRTALLVSVLTEFARRYTQWAAADWSVASLIGDYRARCSTLGVQVSAELPGGQTLTGEASDIDTHGRLLIAGRAVSAGDVTHLHGQY